MRALALVLALLWPAIGLAQPALDGHNTGSATSGTTTTISATTTANPEAVIVGAAVRATGTTNPNLSISGCGLTWTQISSTAQFNNASPKGTAVAAWMAQANSNLSACTITITSDQTNQNTSAAFCSFSGIAASPIDPNPGLPVTNTNSTNTNTTAQLSLSTNLAHSTMVTVIGQTNNNEGGIGASSTASLCANLTNSGGLNFSNIFITYKTFTTTQSSFAIGTNTTMPYWAGFGTAFTADTPLSGRSRILQ